MTAIQTLSRLKLAVFHSSANVLSSLLAFAITLLSVSLTIDYLGTERFGVWMTIASISSMLTFLDMGVGNGLVSQVAKSRASSDSDQLAKTATRGLLILCLIGLVVGSVLVILNHFYPVANFLNIDSDVARKDARQLVSLLIILFSLNIPLNGIFKIMLGLQRGWIVHTIRSLAAIVSMLLIYLLAEREAPPVQLLMATYGVMVLCPIVLVPYFLANDLLTRQANTDWAHATAEYRALINVGGLFLALQIGIMVGWGSDALIISALDSAAAVAQFAIIQRLYQFVSIPMNILNNPLWGAYADAHVQGDKVFIRKTLNILSTRHTNPKYHAVDYPVSTDRAGYWISGLNDHVDVSENLVLAFAIWKVLQSVGHSFSMALNGMHIVKIQVYSVVLLCAIALPMKLVLTPQYGAEGAVWSTVVAYSLSTVLFYAIVFRKVCFQSWKPVTLHNLATKGSAANPGR